jgi:thiamine kinase-like enzyme
MPEPLEGGLPEEVRAILAQVPLFAGQKDLCVCPFSGVTSLNNALYHVRAAGEAYVLRVAAETVHWLGVRRDEEREAARAAARVGIGPAVLWAHPQGHMVMPYIRGRHWAPGEFRVEANLRRLADTLRRLHRVQGVRAEGSVFRRVERLRESVARLALEEPPRLAVYLAAMGRIEAMRRTDPCRRTGLSHNDFWGNNFLDDGSRLWLVDWEFSGNGDGLYDLASLAIGGQYSDAQQMILLEAYGYTAPDALRQLQAMKCMVALFEGFWALVQHGLRGSEEHNYLQMARNTFQLLEALLPLY